MGFKQIMLDSFCNVADDVDLTDRQKMLIWDHIKQDIDDIEIWIDENGLEYGERDPAIDHSIELSGGLVL